MTVSLLFLLCFCDCTSFPKNAGAREKFSVAMAILQLIARPITTIFLAKIAFQSTGFVSCFVGVLQIELVWFIFFF